MPSRNPTTRRAARKDRDGDLTMDGPSIKGRGRIGKAPPTGPAATRGRAPPTGPRGATGSTNGINSNATRRAIIAKAAAAGDVSMRDTRAPRGALVELKVTGWEKSKVSHHTDGGQAALIKWLEQKASMRLAKKGYKIKRSKREGDEVTISVPEVDARAFERMNNYEWAGAKLSITRVGGAGKEQKSSSQAEELKATFRGVLERRWNPDNKFLDLSALGSDAELLAKNIFDEKSTTRKFFPAMMRVLELSFSTPQDRDEAIASVSLANNDLEDLSAVSTLSETLPNLKNLDLSNNKFPNLAALGLWRRRFRKLEHLIVSNSPLEQSEPEYATELMKWYRNLRMLNQVQVRTEEDVKNQNNVNNIPFPIRAPQFQDEGSIVENFIRTWFAGFDTDRNTLTQMYYDNTSEFSLAVNTQAPRDPSGAETTEKQEWGDYIKHSRNLKKINQISARQNRLYRGTQAVAEVFAALPKTKHADLATEGHKWMIESRIQPGIPDPTGASPTGVDGFALSIHGEYEEPVTHKKRSCDHNIMIGPGGPSGVRVVTHMVTIRAYGGDQAHQPVATTPPMQAADAATNDGLPQLPANMTMDQAEQMAAELSKQTGLTLQYAGDCLMQTNFSFEAAIMAYNNVKTTLPPEAFTNGAPAA